MALFAHMILPWTGCTLEGMSGLSRLMRTARGVLRASHEAVATAEKAGKDTIATGGTVVVVGSDMARMAMLRRLITASGYAAATVPADAVQGQVIGFRPIAILVDVACLDPGEAASLVGMLRREVEGPLIGVVGSHDGDACPALLDAGADDIVRGSVAASELRARLCAHSRRRRAEPQRTPVR